MKLHPLTVPAGVVSFGMLAAAGLMSLRVTAGPLNPPAGAVSSTYKTLTEVEPRIAINSTNTPGDADSVFKITQPGSYYLTGNVSGASGKSGIEIATSNVTLDLGGFTVTGGAGSLHGIVNGSGGSIEVIKVRNGVIQNWGGDGVSLFATSHVQVENVQTNSCTTGILVGFNSTVRGCQVQANSLYGISVADIGVVQDCLAINNSSVGVRGAICLQASGCLLTGNGTGLICSVDGQIRSCVARSSSNFGFQLGEYTVVEDCIASASGGEGFLAAAQCQFVRCEAQLNGLAAVRSGFIAGARSSLIDCSSIQNGLHGISAGDGVLVRGCNTASNTGAGISANNGCHIDNNLTRNNQQDGISVNFSCAVIGNNCNGDGTAAGTHGAIKAIGQANRIEGNNISYADRGLYLTSGGNAVFRNSVKGCTVNFDIVGGNDVGPIGSAATATSPWANIQY